MEHQNLFGMATTPTAMRKTKPKATPLQKLEKLMREVEEWEAKIEHLERESPALLEKVRLHTQPIIEECVEIRRRVVAFLEECLPTGSKQKSVKRKMVELILELSCDLEDRFGADMAETIDRHAGPEPEDDRDWNDGEADEMLDLFEAMTGFQLPDPVREAMERVILAGGNPMQCREFVEWLGRPEATGRSGRKTAKAAKDSASAIDPEATAKGIYHGLARELHPDKTQDDDERVRRTSLMQNLTQAWKERDLGALVRLLHAHGSEQVKSDALDDATIGACLKELKNTLRDLERRHRELDQIGFEIGHGFDTTTMLLSRPNRLEQVLAARLAGAEEERREALALERLFSDREAIYEAMKPRSRQRRK
jgi:hypothetical protein